MNEEEKQKHYDIARQLIAEQDFAAAIIAGAVATVLAAAAYGIIVHTWPLAHGFAAAGIGIVVGLAMQYLGRGIATKFAVVATAYTIAGCLLGNLFRVIVGFAVRSATSPIEVLSNNAFSDLAESSLNYFSPIDLIYWFIAVVAAVFLARRPLSRADRLAIGMLELKG